MCFMMFHVLQIHSITFHYTSLHVYLSLSIHPYFCPTFTYTIHTYTYSHLHTGFWAFCNFLRWAPEITQPPRGQPRSTRIKLCQPSFPAVPCVSHLIARSLGPWALAFFSIMAAFFPWSSWVSTSTDFGEHSAAILLRSTDARRIFATSHKKLSNVINMS